MFKLTDLCVTWRVVFRKYLEIPKFIFDETNFFQIAYQISRRMVWVPSPFNLIWCPGNWRTGARHETPRGAKSWKSWFSKRSGSQITVQKLQGAAPARNVKIYIMTRRAFCSVRVIRLQRAASWHVENNWPFCYMEGAFSRLSRDAQIHFGRDQFFQIAY